LPRLSTRARAAEERGLGEWLRAEGIQAAAAGYWSAYRLSLVFEVRPPVVPLSDGQDRVPHHREVFERAQKVALLFADSATLDPPLRYFHELKTQGQSVKLHHIPGFMVLVWERASPHPLPQLP
jgi:hypothetical protein